MLVMSCDLHNDANCPHASLRFASLPACFARCPCKKQKYDKEMVCTDGADGIQKAKAQSPVCESSWFLPSFLLPFFAASPLPPLPPPLLFLLVLVCFVYVLLQLCSTITQPFVRLPFNSNQQPLPLLPSLLALIHVRISVSITVTTRGPRSLNDIPLTNHTNPSRT